jgi:hypothetical protein
MVAGDERLDRPADSGISPVDDVHRAAIFPDSADRHARGLTSASLRPYPGRVDDFCHADLGLDLASRAWRERRLI